MNRDAKNKNKNMTHTQDKTTNRIKMKRSKEFVPEEAQTLYLLDKYLSQQFQLCSKN